MHHAPTKRKKTFFSLIASTFALLLLCSCKFKGETSMNSIQEAKEIIPIGPVKDFDLNDHISTANSLLDAVTDSYSKMNNAVSENTSKKAKKTVENVITLYGNRIEELKQADFSTWSAEDLSALSLELSNIISAIREARDLLGS